MPRQPASLQKHQASKDGKINKTLFNFLENLLVFRTLDDLSVPPESSVKFRISRQEGEPGICLLLHVDNQIFPVVDSEVPRPDYLAIYLHGDGCICTIIEMKSKDNKNLEHGLEQIKSLADRLKTEFAEHLPPRFRLVIQGVLLCRNNAQVPNFPILKMAQDGLIILPALCDNRAELYPYISRKNKLVDRFDNNPRRDPTARSPIEKMMSCGALKKRLPDKIAKTRPGTGAGTGLHINFALPESFDSDEYSSNSDDYAVLATRAKKCVFFVKEQGDEHRQRLSADITANGLEGKFDVAPMPEE